MPLFLRKGVWGIFAFQSFTELPFLLHCWLLHAYKISILGTCSVEVEEKGEEGGRRQATKHNSEKGGQTEEDSGCHPPTSPTPTALGREELLLAAPSQSSSMGHRRAGQAGAQASPHLCYPLCLPPASLPTILREKAGPRQGHFLALPLGAEGET